MSQPERKWKKITVVNEYVVSGKVMDGKLVRFIEHAAYEELEREVERLRAKLARAVEALEKIKSHYAVYTVSMNTGHAGPMTSAKVLDKARETLEKLK